MREGRTSSVRRSERMLDQGRGHVRSTVLRRCHDRSVMILRGSAHVDEGC